MKAKHWKLGTVLLGALILLLFMWGPEGEEPKPIQPTITTSDTFTTSPSSSGHFRPKDRSAPMLAVEDCPTCPDLKREGWDKFYSGWPGGREQAEACLELLRESAEAGIPDPDTTQWNGCRGHTPLHHAKTHEEVEALLAAGADPNARTATGRSPLHLVIRSMGDVAMVEALLAAGADPNAKTFTGQTPLHDVARSEADITMVEALLAAGADPNARNNVGLTPWQSFFQRAPDVLRKQVSDLAFPMAHAKELGIPLEEYFDRYPGLNKEYSDYAAEYERVARLGAALQNATDMESVLRSMGVDPTAAREDATR